MRAWFRRFVESIRLALAQEAFANAYPLPYHLPPLPERTPMAPRSTAPREVDPKDPFDDPTVGDIHDTTENPVLDLGLAGGIEITYPGPVNEPVVDLNVLANMRLARQPNGARCLQVLGRFLTVAEAQDLLLSLKPTIEMVGGIRQDLGYES